MSSELNTQHDASPMEKLSPKVIADIKLAMEYNMPIIIKENHNAKGKTTLLKYLRSLGAIAYEEYMTVVIDIGD